MQKIIPVKNETLWTTYRDSQNNVQFFITSNNSRDTYFLYEVQDKTNKKLGRGRSPCELEEKFNVWGILRKRS